MSFLSCIPIVHNCFNSFPWLTLSKNPLISISTTIYSLLLCISFSACASAFSTPLFGRNPLLLSWNLASHIGSNTCRMHCCINLSSIEAIPSGLFFPLPLSISTRLIAFGVYHSSLLRTSSMTSFSVIFARCSIVFPSIPGVVLPSFFFMFL